MKLHYFAQRSADDDDVDLGAAKVMGYVPESCLLSGGLVWQRIAFDLDPCGGCYGPRERCGGRPAEDSLAPGVSALAEILRARPAGSSPGGGLPPGFADR